MVALAAVNAVSAFAPPEEVMFIVSTPAMVVVPAVTLERVMLTVSAVPATAAAVYLQCLRTRSLQ